MILLKSLTLRNFLSHEETTVTFGENQKLLIDGNSGSGKSTILEGIIWSLYGEGRTANTMLVRRGAQKMSVTLCLTNGTDIYQIDRSINGSKHTLAVQINGVAHPYTGVRELQAWIETELTGASYLLFVNSIAYVQGNPDSFVTQNAAKRKDLLLEIVKTIDFDEYYEKTKTKISQEDKLLSSDSATIALQKEWLRTAQETVKNKEQVEDAIKKHEEVESSVVSAREVSVVELGKVEEKLNTVRRIETDLRAISGDKQQAESLIASLIQQNENKKQLLVTISDRTIAMVQAEIAELEQKLQNINEQLSNAAAVNAARVSLLSERPIDQHWQKKIDEVNAALINPENHNKCSNADCPYYKEHGQKISQYAILLTEYTANLENYNQELSSWSKKFEALEVIDVAPLDVVRKEAQSGIDSLKAELQGLESIESARQLIAANETRIQDLTTQVNAYTEKITSLNADLVNIKLQIDDAAILGHKQNIAACDAKLALTREQKASMQHTLGGILEAEKQIPHSLHVIAEKEKEVESRRKNLEYLSLLKDAFGSKGIRAIVIDYVIPELEEKINAILSQMSEFRVVLDTQQEKADGEGNKEGLFITIINDMGEEMPYESYSGGETLKITVSITEALATLQKCGFRLYDETWVGLDENSLESFARVLDNLLERFPQVVCVSHLQEIKAAFEHKLLVTKHNGVSHVE